MDTTGIEAFVHLMPDTPRTTIERGLASILRVSDRELPKALQDVGDELAFQLVMHPPLQEMLARQAQLGARRARGALLRNQGAFAAGMSSKRLRSRLGASR